MRMGQRQNYSIAVNIVNKNFTFRDVMSAWSSLRPAYPAYTDIIVRNSKKIKEDIAESLCIDNNAPRITKEEANKIFTYLQMMDVFSLSNIYVMPSIDLEKRLNQNAYFERKHILQTQSGIRYWQVQAALDTIWDVLRVHGAQISRKDFDRIAGADARGRIMEDAIFSDILTFFPEHCSIAKLEWQENEAKFDIAVIDNRGDDAKISLIEVQHDKEYRLEYTNNLRNRAS